MTFYASGLVKVCDLRGTRRSRCNKATPFNYWEGAISGSPLFQTRLTWAKKNLNQVVDALAKFMISLKIKNNFSFVDKISLCNKIWYLLISTSVPELGSLFHLLLFAHFLFLVRPTNETHKNYDMFWIQLRSLMKNFDWSNRKGSENDCLVL